MLPACWSDSASEFQVAVNPFGCMSSTSTKAAILLLKAIVRAYELAERPLENAAEIAELTV